MEHPLLNATTLPGASFRLPDFLRELMLSELVGKIANSRAPDFIIGRGDQPYLRRWHVMPRGEGPSCYLHHFLRSDDDRALHDHPWPSVSIILDGSYIEHLPGQMPARRVPGDVTFRAPEDAHRVELLASGPAGGEQPVWTLFLVGQRVREWGFHCPQGWKHWTDFCGVTPDGLNDGTVGRGCG